MDRLRWGRTGSIELRIARRDSAHSESRGVSSVAPTPSTRRCSRALVPDRTRNIWDRDFPKFPADYHGYRVGDIVARLTAVERRPGFTLQWDANFPESPLYPAFDSRPRTRKKHSCSIRSESTWTITPTGKRKSLHLTMKTKKRGSLTSPMLVTL